MNDDAARAAWAESLEPVTRTLLDLARPAPGERVLDLGAGTGELARRLAALVGERGSVVAADPSADAIEAAGRAPRVPGSAPVLSVCASAEALDVEGGFDCVVARNSVMYFGDLDRALSNAHRLLRPGGRLVASVYAALEHEPYHAIPLTAVLGRGPLSPPLPEYVAAFGVGGGEVIAALGRAGFRSTQWTEVAVRRTYPSMAAFESALRASRSLGELLARRSPDELPATWAEMLDSFSRFVRTDGVVVIPGRQVVVSAVA